MKKAIKDTCLNPLRQSFFLDRFGGDRTVSYQMFIFLLVPFNEFLDVLRLIC